VTGRALTLALAFLAGACTGSTGGGGEAASGADEAERLYQEGVSWASKAETAPLPTPDAATSTVVPEFKAEELRALESFEKAIAARPEHGGAHLALANLLAPHAIRRIEFERRAKEAQEAAAQSRPRRGGPASAAPMPTLAPVGMADVSPARVLRAYQAAVQADPGRAPVEALVAFAVRVGQLDAAEAGHLELLRRVKESPEPHALYGDFLVAHRKDLEAAIDQYRQALIWKADDEATRGKLADIYLTRGIDYYGRQEFVRAAAELREAEKYVTDRDSPQGRRLQSYLKRMREIRR
jgi:hypothetical protein